MKMLWQNASSNIQKFFLNIFFFDLLTFTVSQIISVAYALTRENILISELHRKADDDTAW